MNRREMLRLIAYAAPGALILPNVGRRFFLPPKGGWLPVGLANKWLAYAREIAPVGVLVDLEFSQLDHGPHVTTVCEGPQLGTVTLTMPRSFETFGIHAGYEERMRRVLDGPIIYPWPSATLASLMPWEKFA